MSSDLLKLLQAVLFDLIFIENPLPLHLKVRRLEPLLKVVTLHIAIIKVALSRTADMLRRAKDFRL